MTRDLSTLAWPVAHLGIAIEALARESGLQPRAVPLPAAPEQISHDRDALTQWIETASAWLGVDAEPVALRYQEVQALLSNPGPALLRLKDNDVRFLLLLGSRHRTVSVLRPDLGIEFLSPTLIRDFLCQPLEAFLVPEVDAGLADADISEQRQEQARAAMLSERLRDQPVSECWFLHLTPGANFWAQLRLARLPQRILLLASMHTVQYVLWILSWWLIGRAALEGWFDYGWLLGWGLLLLTLVPFQLLTTWLQGVIAIGGGVLLKRRLLYGALCLRPEEIRNQGVGQFLGRVIESEAVESLALSGGFLALVAAIELAISIIVLGAGAGGVLHALLLLGWIVVTLVLSRRYFEHRQDWAKTRLRMTQDLVEHMVGHRTRLVQEPREHWHDADDQTLERYLETSEKMDHSGAVLLAFVPRGWLVVGFLGLVRVFVMRGATPVSLAIALGGILLANRALTRLAAGLENIADAAISWRQVAQLFSAAARPPLVSPPIFTFTRYAPESNGRRLVEAHDLVFQYQDRSDPVLRGCNLTIGSGERLLLEGTSGGGKSTFTSLLTGMRSQHSGLLLLDGLDRNTLGEDGWRRRIVAAPQFHENHVFTETLAFNLLMGRRWPPREEDLKEAETMCRELGLGGLLGRMPAGLQQMVGETGWQLSHGERSRLYIARALLQGSGLIILDESFAALDPETLRQSLSCILRRAPTLMVIAHP